jgi:hypothetical protein
VTEVIFLLLQDNAGLNLRMLPTACFKPGRSKLGERRVSGKLPSRVLELPALSAGTQRRTVSGAHPPRTVFLLPEKQCCQFTSGCFVTIPRSAAADMVLKCSPAPRQSQNTHPRCVRGLLCLLVGRFSEVELRFMTG